MESIKNNSPFIVVDVVSATPWAKGWANFIHVKTNKCVALIHKFFVDDLKEFNKMEPHDGPCPFEAIDIISKGYEGYINFCYIDYDDEGKNRDEGSYAIAMAEPIIANDLKKLINAWEMKNEEETKRSCCSND